MFASSSALQYRSRAVIALHGARRPQVNPRRLLIRTKYQGSDGVPSTPWADWPKESNYSVSGKDAVLTRAEEELGQYCSRFQDPAQAKECWDTYWFLKEKHLTSVKACTAEVKDQGAPASSCGELEQLEQIIRELEASGKEDNLYQVLSLMRRLESAEYAPTPKATACSVDPEAALLRKRAEELFRGADTNGNGRLDVAEFRDAMSKMTTALSGEEVAQICDALDIHGFIELDQFVDICIAERSRLQNPDSDAEFLRHVAHLHGHSHDHPTGSTWA